VKAYLKGQMQIQCRDIRDLEDGSRVVVLAIVLIDEEGRITCELEPVQLDVGKSLMAMESITFVPIQGKLSGE
jgi:hypothetical protein